ncbi:MAG: hypothetical protein SF162_03965 [bacterium]|nr:hypothetical protein [bacterium]
MHSRFTNAFLVLLSAVLTAGQSFGLNGTLFAFALTLGFQVLLPGVLLSRYLHIHTDEHPVTSLITSIGTGFGLTIVMGGVLRAMGIGIPIYLLLLHSFMLLLAFAQPQQVKSRSSQRRADLPYYVLTAFACLLLLYLGIQRTRVHFDMEVPTIYASQVTWLASNPDTLTTPLRWLGLEANAQAGNRMHLDGWTYIHAAWSWTSGLSGAWLIWHTITPSLVMLIPLTTFATIHRLFRRVDYAAWGAAMTALFAALTLDTFVFVSIEHTLNFGGTVFYMHAVRNASTVLILPLALLALVGYLVSPKLTRLLPLLLLGHALALMRVRQIFVFEVIAFGLLAFWLLANPRIRVRPALPLVVVLLSFTLLPIQMYVQPALSGAVYLSEVASTTDSRAVLERLRTAEKVPVIEGISFVSLPNVPVIGDTFIVDPRVWFNHPFMIIAALIGLAAIAVWRTPGGGFLFAVTFTVLVTSFFPGITPLAVEVFGSAATVNLIGGLAFGLPVGIALGVAIGWTIDRLTRVRLLRPLSFGAVSALLFAGILLVFEPLPIAASVRDRAEAINLLQGVRGITRADSQFLTDYAAAFDPNAPTRILADERTSAFLVETFPRVWVQGWESTRPIVNGSSRFFALQTPWIDTQDIEFLQTAHIEQIVIPADHPSAAQLALDPERFTLALASSGWWVFTVNPGLQTTLNDAQFRQMNIRYAETDQPRWADGQFHMARGADPVPWQSVLAAWVNGTDLLAAYGAAMTRLLMGDDAAARPLWEHLTAARPDVPLLKQALAHTYAEAGEQASGRDLLLDALDVPQPAVQVLAARTLLSESFFFTLTPEHIARIVAVSERYPDVWQRLNQWDNPNGIRTHAAMIMTGAQYQAAADWLSAITPARLQPRDLVSLAAVRLMQHDTEGALNILYPATDPDWVAPRAHMHSDEWRDEQNIAAQAYHLLRDGQAQPATEDSTAPLQTLVGASNLMLVSLEAFREDDAVRVRALVGSLLPRYVPRTLHLSIVSPDSSQYYAGLDIQVNPVPGGLRRVEALLPVAAEGELINAILVARLEDTAIIPLSTAFRPLVLNPPPSAAVPSDAVRIDRRFGESIMLEAVHMNNSGGLLTVDLYWRSDSALTEDFQVFVHLVDATGTVIAQSDSSPAGGRYPTSAWEPTHTILDSHSLSLPDAQPHSILVGLYRLPSLERLPISPQDAQTAGSSLRLAVAPLE